MYLADLLSDVLRSEMIRTYAPVALSCFLCCCIVFVLAFLYAVIPRLLDRYFGDLAQFDRLFCASDVVAEHLIPSPAHSSSTKRFAILPKNGSS